MPEEIIGSTAPTDGPEPTGEPQTAGEEPVDGVDTSQGADGQPAEEAGPAEAPKYGQFDSPEKLLEGYQQLESKLGNWKDVEEKARLYDEQLSRTEPQAPAPQTAKPDYSGINPETGNIWSPQEIVSDIETRATEKAYQKLKAELDPLKEDYYTGKATKAIANVSAKFPDFEEHKEAIGAYLSEHPGLVQSEQTLEDVYKIVTYHKAEARGEQKAITKMKEKSRLAPPQGAGGATSTSQGAKTIAEAWRLAEGSS